MGSFAEALARGRDDYEFFSHFFLGEHLHASQVEWLENADAQINVGATANRWGKSHIQVTRHYHSNIYKIGAEYRYIDVTGGYVDSAAFEDVRYETLSTAQGWDTVAIVWQRAFQLTTRPNLAPFIKNKPKSIPPYIEFTNGAKWRFRTMGPKGQGLDGYSFYLITVDEAGWIENLEEIISGVGRIRTADVQGRIDLMGTFKPGVSRDFYGYAVRAATYTGRNIAFDFESWERGRAAA